jgi:hypothetical protein
MKPERIEAFLRRVPPDEPRFVNAGVPADGNVRRVKVSRRPAGAIGLGLAGIVIIAVLAVQTRTAPFATSFRAPASSTASPTPTWGEGYSEQCAGATVTASDIAATPEPLSADEQAVIGEAVGRAPTLLPAATWHRLTGANGDETFVAVGYPNAVRRFVYITAGPVGGEAIGLVAFGDCMPMGRGVDGLTKTSWMLEVDDPAATMPADVTLLHGYAETSSMTTFAGYTVTYGRGSVAITFWQRMVPSASGIVHTLEGDLDPVTVLLAEPLGGRDVYDGLLGHEVQISLPLPSDS